MQNGSYVKALNFEVIGLVRPIMLLRILMN